MNIKRDSLNITNLNLKLTKHVGIYITKKKIIRIKKKMLIKHLRSYINNLN